MLNRPEIKHDEQGRVDNWEDLDLYFSITSPVWLCVRDQTRRLNSIEHLRTLAVTLARENEDLKAMAIRYARQYGSL